MDATNSNQAAAEAIDKNVDDGKAVQKHISFIIKRHKGKGVAGGARYSFEPRMAKNPFTGNDEPDTLWAQERHGKTRMYVISSNVSDLTKPRSERSPQFLGKLDVQETNKVYVGYKQKVDAANDDKEPVVAVVYDHERTSVTDSKMDVAVPLISFAKENITMVSPAVTSSKKAPDALLRLFMKIRHEGQENYLDRDKLLLLRQCDDSPEIMGSETILSTQLKDIATCVSSKNFSLVPKKPSREWDTKSHKNAPGAATAVDTANVPADDQTSELQVTPAVPTVFACANSASAVALPVDLDLSGADCTSFLQFGKRNDDVYYCNLTSELITPLMAFMIILSRFDTVQKL